MRLEPSNRNVALMMGLGIEPDDVVYAEQMLGPSDFLRVQVLRRDEHGLPIPLGNGQGYLTTERTFSTQQVVAASERLGLSTKCDPSRAGDSTPLHSTLISPPQHQ